MVDAIDFGSRPCTAQTDCQALRIDQFAFGMSVAFAPQHSSQSRYFPKIPRSLALRRIKRVPDGRAVIVPTGRPWARIC